MEFTDFVELTKNTGFELCYEKDKTRIDKYPLYNIYVKYSDGRKIHLIDTTDFTIAFESYFCYTMGSLVALKEHCEKLEDKIYGKISEDV